MDIGIQAIQIIRFVYVVVVEATLGKKVSTGKQVSIIIKLFPGLFKVITHIFFVILTRQVFKP